MGSKSIERHAPLNRPQYKVVATSLLAEDVLEADRVADVLREEGWPHANRSLVVREGLARLFEELHGKSPEDIFRYFIDRRGRRIARDGSGNAA